MFHKYPSIENAYRTKTVNLIREMGLANDKWIVSTKVHGANFSVWYNSAEKHIRYGKRTRLLGDNASFYSYKAMVDREESKFLSLFTELGQDTVIFGELCGGYYFHPEVEQSNERCVQKGVYYSPKTEFYAFDIYTDNFMNIEAANKLFLKHGLLYAKTMFSGTLNECLEYPNAYQDPIYSWLGLPRLEKDNICEGNVIKPVDPLYFGNGSRIILKNKNEKFSEVSRGDKPKKEIDYNLDTESLIVYDFLSAYITENRLRNVISKIGEITQQDFGKTTGLFTQDVLDDGKKDGSGLNELSKVQQKLVKRRVQSDCVDILRANFVNILDVEF